MPTRLSRRTLLAGAAGLSAISAVSARAHGKPQTVNATFEVHRFVEDVRRARLEADSQKAVEEVLRRAVSDSASVLRGVGEPTEA